MPAKGVFFDLYGTLLIYGDMTRAWRDWMRAFHGGLELCGLTLSRESFSLRCRNFFSRPEPPLARDGLTVLERRVAAFAGELGLDLEPEGMRRTVDRFIDAWQAHVTLDPDALRVLRSLRPKKALALVSNFDHPPFVRRLLDETGLADLFDAVVISGEVGVKKPDPGIFTPALRGTGLDPGEAVHVGDAPEDVAGARAAGLLPVWIHRPEGGNAQTAADYRGDAAAPDGSSDPFAACTGAKKIATLPELLDILHP